MSFVMHSALRCATRVQFFAIHTFHSHVVNANEDIRERLTAAVKQAMRDKDSVVSTTLRSVLSEVYNLDKTTGFKASSSAVLGALRKAVRRRAESAAEFTKAGRPDLAQKESREVEIISTFLPPLISEAEIDRLLKEAIAEHPQNIANSRTLGNVFKSFYSKVDKSNVDADLVKSRASILLRTHS